MRIAATYSFKQGKEKINQAYPTLLAEIGDVIAEVDAADHKTKQSKEKTMHGRILYSPSSLNKAFKMSFERRGWAPVKVTCEYSDEYYEPDYQRRRNRTTGAFREMDFVKEKLGIEVQFGKYAFMVYNVCAKMTIFRNLGHIDYGVEIVPVKSLVAEMSTGVSYFEQFVWDLENRGVSNIDIPVFIIGLDV
jgi:hypothetical protein